MTTPSDAAVTQTPKFGDWMRGIYASEKNPLRDGMFVRTIRRTGRCNPGTYYELTDGRGKFWQYPRESTVMLDVDTRAQAPAAGDALDAARYRFLRANAVYGRFESDDGSLALNCDEPEKEWDAHIDAAMTGGLTGGGGK